MARRSPVVAVPLAMVLLVVAWAPGCTSAERAAQDAYELAQFEQRQGNAEHARKLYEDIVAKHPETIWAEKARASLANLQSTQPQPVPSDP